MTQPAATTLSADERLDRFLDQQGLRDRSPQIVALTGDASDRRYYRVTTGEASMVAAVYAGAIDFATSSFANVAELFASVPLPVPKILGHSDPDGVIAQSDLGDVTLQTHLEGAAPEERMRLYREAVSLLGRLQRRGAELQSDRYLPYRIAFDVEKLTWEMNFFVKHFLEAYRGAQLTASHRDVLAEEWATMVEELAAEPRVVCHRDYHSRNLMVVDGHLHVIDFQDARMGPDTYDLVSLLRDSYVELEESDVDALIALFRSLKSKAPDAQEFRRRFDLMALQRNLKALGTFGYQTTTRANPVYAQYVPRTLTYVRSHLARYPRFARLRGVLAEQLEELR